MSCNSCWDVFESMIWGFLGTGQLGNNRSLGSMSTEVCGKLYANFSWPFVKPLKTFHEYLELF